MSLKRFPVILGLAGLILNSGCVENGKLYEVNNDTTEGDTTCIARADSILQPALKEMTNTQNNGVGTQQLKIMFRQAKKTIYDSCQNEMNVHFVTDIDASRTGYRECFILLFDNTTKQQRQIAVPCTLTDSLNSP